MSDVEGRPGLDAVFRPRSVAVVGASRRPGAIGHEIFRNLLEAGFQGPVYPVNPGAVAVRSVRAYPDLASIPGPVDLAVVTVPAAAVPAVIEACGAKGVRGVILISAGFAEVGGSGVERQQQLVEAVQRHGIRLVGPNCLGVVATDPEVKLNATFAPHEPPPGRVAFASQSGALGVAILDHARDLGIGISTFVSVGNKADLTVDELLAYWKDDPRTDVILLYLESFGNPAQFTRVAREVSRTTPIVAVKGGRTASGSKAASSHTGSLAGVDKAVDAAFSQAGVIRVDTVEELFDTAMLLENQPLPAGPRLGVLTNAGGPGILAADAAEGVGLEVPALSAGVREQLQAFLPAEASTHNPVDMIAAAGPDEFGQAARVLLASGEVDALLVLFVPPVASRTDEVARQIAAAARDQAVPVVTCFLGTHGVPAALRTLEGAGIPSYRFPEAAVRALARARGYQRWRQRPVEAPPRFEDVDSRAGAAAVAEADGAGWLTAGGVKSLLGAYGIFHVDTRFAASEEEAVGVAEALGGPLAMKVVADGVLHKSDVRGVRLGLREPAHVRAGFRDMEAALEAQGRTAAFRGVLLQPMVTGGVEVAVGTARDPVFGPMVMVGTGGVNLELLEDVRFGLHPLDAGEPGRMIRSLQGYPLLDGYRGRAPADVASLEALVLRVDRMLADRPEVQEMDLNPVLVLPKGKGCVVVDARVRVAT